MSQAPSDHAAEGEPTPGAAEPERDLASLLLAAYFLAMIVVVVALLLLPAIL